MQLKIWCLHLQGSFQKLIKGLQSLDYSILDVNSHRWHDDYNKFKAGIKDLEVMLTNVIQLGFDNASSLVGRVELLEVPPQLHESVHCLKQHLACCCQDGQVCRIATPVAVHNTILQSQLDVSPTTTEHTVSAGVEKPLTLRSQHSQQILDKDRALLR